MRQNARRVASVHADLEVVLKNMHTSNGRRQGVEHRGEIVNFGFEKNDSLELGKAIENGAQGRFGRPEIVEDDVACVVAAWGLFCGEIDVAQEKHSLA